MYLGIIIIFKEKQQKKNGKKKERKEWAGLEPRTFRLVANFS